MKTPTEFVRVEDRSSRDKYIRGEGITAPDTFSLVDYKGEGALLFTQLEQHLRWGNRRATPFISTYYDEDVAWNEAERRVFDGKKDVRMHYIVPGESEEAVEYRSSRGLIRRTGLDNIPYKVWKNAECEYLFLHHIPDSMIIGTEYF